MIPIEVKSGLLKFRNGNENKIGVPTTVMLRILYYNDNIRRILKAELILDDYVEVVNKDMVQAAYVEEFNGGINFSDSKIVTSKMYQFYRDQFIYSYMGTTNYLLLNFYSNTTQFNTTYPNFFTYLNFSESQPQIEAKDSSTAGYASISKLILIFS